MNDGPLFPENAVEAGSRTCVVRFLHSLHGADFYLVEGSSIDVITGPEYHEWTYVRLNDIYRDSPSWGTPEQRQHLETLAALYR